MSTANSRTLEDVWVGVRLKISALWIAVLFLFAASVYIAIASVMVFLSLVLRPGVNRWANIVLPILYIVSVVASVIGETAYLFFLSIVETGLLLLIIRYAWTWPRQVEPSTQGDAA